MIGLKNGGLIVDHPATLLALGNFQVTETLLAALGFLIITGLATRQFPGRHSAGHFERNGHWSRRRCRAVSGRYLCPALYLARYWVSSILQLRSMSP